MPELLRNVPTRNAYAAAVTLGPVKNCKQLNFLGVGQPFFVTLWKPDPNDPNGFPVEEGQEREYPANGSDVFQNVSGAKFRSKVAGQPASMYAELAYATDPLSLGSGVTSASIGPGGQIVPVVSLINGITGKVSSGGVVVAGTGFAAVRTGLGSYSITFSPALSAAPVVVVTSDDLPGSTIGASESNVTAAGFDVVTWVPSPLALSDRAFDFLAIVPQ